MTAIDLGVEIESKIRNAILAGKIATAHEKPVSFLGGTNVGYILTDPETGSGAYLISGGRNGALLLISSFILFYVALIVTV